MHFGETIRNGFTRGLLTRYAWRTAAKARIISPPNSLELGLVERPHYAYGLIRAASQAKTLGFSEFTAIEFGVAGGNGLIAMEEYAQLVSQEFGIKINIVGFDSGQGLPKPTDYRDLPYLWAEGDFVMDEALLRARLHFAELILGDVKDTVNDWVNTRDARSPIGFVSFDLDLWSSTVSALNIFRGDPSLCLPRVWCYFDDIVGTIEDIGELLAIREFNEERNDRKLRKPYMLRANIPFQPTWADQMFQAHFFQHELYNELISHFSDRELPLK